MEEKPVTAGMVVIGNEVLSGRTRDANIQFIGTELNALGIRLNEVRIIADICEDIGGAVMALAKTYDYVFVTGGLGPTHDDITAHSIAKAFNRELVCDPEARARLERHYGKDRFNTARARMALIPSGASLIDNPVSAAPGFHIENVFVMAGIPRIMQAMFAGITHLLSGGAPLKSRTIATDIGEGTLAVDLGHLQKEFPDVQIGSYPSTGAGRTGLRIVLRSVSTDRLENAANKVCAMAKRLGGTAQKLDISG